MSAPWDEVLDVGTVLDLYQMAMQRGGMASPPRPGCVEQCLGNAWNAEGYRQEEGQRLGLLFACYVMFYLAMNHCFTDGNKRLAWASLTFVLSHYGLSVDASEDEAVEFVLSVAAGDCNVDGAIDWVTDRLSELT